MIYNIALEYVDSISIINIIRYITFRGICAFFTAFSVALFIMPYCIRILQSLQCQQEILEYVELHRAKSGTPTMGGIVIIIAVLIASLLWTDIHNPYVWYTLLVMSSFGAIGFIDDFTKVMKKQNLGLTARMKFTLQFCISLVVLYLLVKEESFSTILYFPFFKHVRFDIGFFYIPFGALILIASSNAVNLTDGLDGLATGSSAIASATLAILLYVTGNIAVASYLQIPHTAGVGEAAIIAVAFVGACMGFLWYNAYPASIFMGDVGSLSIGGTLGFFAILAKQEILLTVIGGLFVIETLSVILQVTYFKASKGKRIFLMAPLHHHFEKKGIPESKIIVRFWLLALVFSIIALSSLKLR